MEEEYYRIDKYLDTFKGKNYGLIPVKTDGTLLNNRFKHSEKWELIQEKRNIDERNDNQCDVDRGSNLTYQNIETKKLLELLKNVLEAVKQYIGRFVTFLKSKLIFSKCNVNNL